MSSIEMLDSEKEVIQVLKGMLVHEQKFFTHIREINPLMLENDIVLGLLGLLEVGECDSIIFARLYLGASQTRDDYVAKLCAKKINRKRLSLVIRKLALAYSEHEFDDNNDYLIRAFLQKCMI